jgi:hypothetical protein
MPIKARENAYYIAYLSRDRVVIILRLTRERDAVRQQRRQARDDEEELSFGNDREHVFFC